MGNNNKQKLLDALWDDHINSAHPDQLTLMDVGIGRPAFEPVYDIPSTRNGWAWMQLVEYSPFRVDQFKFPQENSGHVLQGPTPCTDGETLWIPVGSLDSCASFLFHEMAHALMHYPNGKDPGLLDPARLRDESVWEFEACIVAAKVLRELGLVDIYNKYYMRAWYGEHADIDLRKVYVTAERIISLYQSKRQAEETAIGGR